MNTLTPFNLPPVTAAYVVLYGVTLLLHVVFMAYVLGGSIMLGVAGLRRMLGRVGPPSDWSAVTTVLKDWMPFALSAAITAGIAPLLFVQILYQQAFYTANLLSFHRWMAIVPVLILAFYLLYLLKAHRIEGKLVLQSLTAMAAMACILFVAWSWVENHLLSLNRQAWPVQYLAGAMIYTDPKILPRLAFYIASAFPAASVLLAWQLRAGASGVSAEAARRSTHLLAYLAVISSVVAAAMVGWIVPAPAATTTSPDLAASMQAGVLAAWAGTGVVLSAWLPGLLRKPMSLPALLAASAGTGGFWLGTLYAREAARLSLLVDPSLLERHAQVGTWAGFAVFVTFAVLGLGAIAYVVRAVAQARTSRSGQRYA